MFKVCALFVTQPPDNTCIDCTAFSTHPAAAVARDRVANVLLAYKGKHGPGGAARAAEDIARQTARSLLSPLLDTACARLAFILRRVFDTAADVASGSGEANCSFACVTSTGKLEDWIAYQWTTAGAAHASMAMSTNGL